MLEIFLGSQSHVHYRCCFLVITSNGLRVHSYLIRGCFSRISHLHFILEYQSRISFSGFSTEKTLPEFYSESRFSNYSCTHVSNVFGSQSRALGHHYRKDVPVITLPNQSQFSFLEFSLGFLCWLSFSEFIFGISFEFYWYQLFSDILVCPNFRNVSRKVSRLGCRAWQPVSDSSLETIPGCNSLSFGHHV